MKSRFSRMTMRGTLSRWLPAVCLALMLSVCSFAAEQPAPSPAVIPTVVAPATTPPLPEPPGDRVKCSTANIEEWIPAALSRDSYRIAPGDVLTINVVGRANLNYVAQPNAAQGVNPDEVTVTPGGDIYLPLAGKIRAAGKTVSQIEEAIREKLAEYIKEFEVSVAVSRVHTVNVWISGEVDNPGPQMLPAVSSVSLAALQAGIKSTGSTRRIILTRDGTQHVVDLYRMTITGNIEGDMALEPGDSVHVPAVTDYVEISGEVTRPGKYEMVCKSGSGDFKACSLIELALRMTPAAAKDRAFIERIADGGQKKAVYLNLGDSSDDPILQPGDKLVVPSVSAFQPMVRLIGEFKGDGVYQRIPGTTATDIENKSGIYFLKQGQTVLDVISATGGVTPQADLRRARIERRQNGVAQNVPVDLERLLVQGDKTADVALLNGDSLVLPAVADRIHVFGEVERPGSFIYSPNRHLIDYLGDAGGPTERSKLNEVSVVRAGDTEKPKIVKLNAKAAVRGESSKGNPVLEPGDIVYVPSKFISGWRDATQMILSSFSLISLFQRR